MTSPTPPLDPNPEYQASRIDIGRCLNFAATIIDDNEHLWAIDLLSPTEAEQTTVHLLQHAKAIHSALVARLTAGGPGSFVSDPLGPASVSSSDASHVLSSSPVVYVESSPLMQALRRQAGTSRGKPTGP